MKRFLPLLFVPLFLLTACSKYEEGGATLASKKSRLVNHWKTYQLTINGADVTSWNIITDVNITDNNTIIVNGSPFGISTSSSGGWVFDNDKSHVLVTNNDGSLDSYEIIMLQKDESKFRRTDSNGDLYFYHFKTF